MTEPVRIVGRRRELLAIHKVFTSQATHSSPVLVLQGPPGVGKTALAEHYGVLFQHVFTGGVIRLGPFSHHPPEEFLSHFHLTLARAMSARLGIDVAGITLGRLLELCAERLTTGGPLLLLIDDVPVELPPSVVHRLLPPSREVATLITTRAGLRAWDSVTLEVPGLTEDEGVRLFGTADIPAARRLVRRCGGNPFALRAIRSAVERLLGPFDESVLDEQPDTAAQAIRALLGRLSPLARGLLRLGTVLAPVPFPLEFAAEALGSPGTTELDHAVQELVSVDFLSQVDGGVRIPALVRAVATAVLDPGDLPERAAQALLGVPHERQGADHDLLVHHARTLAEHAPAYQVRLLRPVASAFEHLGDWSTAGETHALILSTGTATATDLTAASRAEIACGLYARAVAHARQAVALAGDELDRHHAALTAARALDCQGDYAAADQVFWTEHGDRLPSDEPARLDFLRAVAKARRLRGRPAEAAALFEGTLPERTTDDLTQSAKLEYATCLLDAGRAEQARKVAAEVVASYWFQGRDRHSRCVEAELVRADATLTLDSRAFRQRPPELPAGRLRDLERLYKMRHGADDPLTLTAKVMADRALLALGRPDHALRALKVTEQAVLRVFGEGCSLHHRVVHAMAVAHGELREFGHQADLLDTILEAQTSRRGLTHPETLETRLDLGVALLLCGRPRRAAELIDHAAEDIAAAPGVGAEVKAKALAARQLSSACSQRTP